MRWRAPAHWPYHNESPIPASVWYISNGFIPHMWWYPVRTWNMILLVANMRHLTNIRSIASSIWNLILRNPLLSTIKQLLGNRSALKTPLYIRWKVVRCTWDECRSIPRKALFWSARLKIKRSIQRLIPDKYDVSTSRSSAPRYCKIQPRPDPNHYWLWDREDTRAICT